MPKVGWARGRPGADNRLDRADVSPACRDPALGRVMPVGYQNIDRVTILA